MSVVESEENDPHFLRMDIVREESHNPQFKTLFDNCHCLTCGAMETFDEEKQEDHSVDWYYYCALRLLHLRAVG